MEILDTSGRLWLTDISVSIKDLRQASKVEHDLVELMVAAVAAVLAGADTFVKIEIWAEEKLDWLRQYLPLVHSIASQDTFGRLFRLIESSQFEAAFRCWMQGVFPALDAPVVAIDGKTSGPSGGWMQRSCIWSRPLRPAPGLGWAAVKGKYGHRPKGSWFLLSPDQEREVQGLIQDRTPDQLKMSYALWTRQTVGELTAPRNRSAFG